MTEYVDRLCRLGIPACSAVMIVQDFLKNFGTIALDELLDAVQVYNPKLYKSFLRKL